MDGGVDAAMERWTDNRFVRDSGGALAVRFAL
jgi:Flp pilus assembly protein TadG